MPFRTGLFRPAAVATSDLLAEAAVATPAAAGAAAASTVLDVLEIAGGRRNAYWNQQNSAPAVENSRTYAVTSSGRRGHLGPAAWIPVDRTSTVSGAPSRTRIRLPGCHGARA